MFWFLRVFLSDVSFFRESCLMIINMDYVSSITTQRLKNSTAAYDMKKLLIFYEFE